ncbi:MAG: tandem-95 repeat protein, partial [Gammaproteobacteria bacterium]|nr:tandem-95 repeat protein [Gammaproteobacteria bacterium]
MASFYIRITYFPLVFLLLLGLISCGVVDDAGEGVNDPPSVVGGADQTVDEQTTVILTSSVTDDFEGIQSSNWQQIDGPAVVLQNADSTEATFTAPQVLVQNSPQILEFRITVKDNFGASASATVKVAVRAVNISPVATEDGGSVDEGMSVTLNVTDNDADQDGQIVFDSIEIFSAPASGDAVANDDGTITYTQNGAETLSDGFTYTIRDNETTVSDPATVSITINPINDPPEAQAGTLVINEDATNAGGTLSATDPDSTVMFSRVSDATHGSATVNGNGSYTYRPDSNFSGSDSFTFGVTDGEFASMAQVTITVNPVNDAPRFTSSAPKTAKVG